MQASEYRLSTVWRLEAPLHAVWNAIHDSARWPEWWKSVEQVAELETGSSDGIGALQRYTWKGRLPYRVVFDVRVTRIEPLVALEGMASGDLEGIGCWRFSSERDGVKPNALKFSCSGPSVTKPPKSARQDIKPAAARTRAAPGGLPPWPRRAETWPAAGRCESAGHRFVSQQG